MLRLRLRAHQLEHGQPVADLAAVLLEKLARQLEDVALWWSGLGVGVKVGVEVGVGVRGRVSFRVRLRVRLRVSAKAMLLMGQGRWEGSVGLGRWPCCLPIEAARHGGAGDGVEEGQAVLVPHLVRVRVRVRTG